MAPFRLIGVSTSKFLIEGENISSNFIFNPKFKRIEKAELTIDKIREKFGKEIIKKGRSLN